MYNVYIYIYIYGVQVYMPSSWCWGQISNRPRFFFQPQKFISCLSWFRSADPPPARLAADAHTTQQNLESRNAIGKQVRESSNRAVTWWIRERQGPAKGMNESILIRSVFFVVYPQHTISALDEFSNYFWSEFLAVTDYGDRLVRRLSGKRLGLPKPFRDTRTALNELFRGGKLIKAANTRALVLLLP